MTHRILVVETNDLNDDEVPEGDELERFPSEWCAWTFLDDVPEVDDIIHLGWLSAVPATWFGVAIMGRRYQVLAVSDEIRHRNRMIYVVKAIKVE